MDLLKLDMTRHSIQGIGTLTAGERILTTNFVHIGPNIAGNKEDFTAGKACSPGYVRARCDIKKLSRDGDCSFSGWVSSAADDGRAAIHVGVKAFEWFEGYITVIEAPAT